MENQVCKLLCIQEEKEKIATLELGLEEDYVEIRFLYNDLVLKKRGDNFFDVLLNLREELEKYGIQLLCKGCCKNVYPSGMLLSMGEGRRAYTLTLGEQAKMESLVDIFAPCSREEYSTIEAQLQFFEKWTCSLR